MTHHRERLSHNSYMDDEGDILPYANIENNFDSALVHNESIIQGRENLKTHARQMQDLERFEAEAAWEKLRDKSPGPHVSLEQYYQDQLDLIDFVSGSFMRRGFKKAAPVDEDIQTRYGEDLPRVEAGAERNHRRSIHNELPRIYHADELIAAGFDPDEVMFDAKTILRMAAQEEYGGPQNKNKRAARRKELKAKRDLHRQ
jgi:hypothetical protein